MAAYPKGEKTTETRIEQVKPCKLHSCIDITAPERVPNIHHNSTVLALGREQNLMLPIEKNGPKKQLTKKTDWLRK